MPSFQDSAVIFFIALLLFGPKKLPELARYVGKLMSEFRRASSEFRMQMEDEFRVAEQVEQQKKIAAIEAAAPVPPIIASESETGAASSPDAETEVLDPDYPRPLDTSYDQPPAEALDPVTETASSEPATESTPVPIASSGDLHLMPPATGLPVGRTSSSSSLGDVFDSIPHTPDPAIENETPTHG